MAEELDALAASGGTDDSPDVGITDDDRGGADEADFAFAAAQGWVPKSKWKGNPDEWTDAKSFADKGRSINALLRTSNKRLESEVATLKADFGKYQEMTQKEHEARVKNLEAKLKSQRTQAVADGDGEAFERAEAGLASLAQARAKPTSTPTLDPVHVQAAEAWQERNDWYGSDNRKTVLANVVTQQLVLENPELKGNVPAVLARLDTELAKSYPEIFGVKKPNGTHSRVDDGAPGGGGEATRPGRKLGFKDMPKDAQVQAQRMVDRKMLKSVDDYVKNYDFGAKP